MHALHLGPNAVLHSWHAAKLRTGSKSGSLYTRTGEKLRVLRSRITGRKAPNFAAPERVLCQTILTDLVKRFATHEGLTTVISCAWAASLFCDPFFGSPGQKPRNLALESVPQVPLSDYCTPASTNASIACQLIAISLLAYEACSSTYTFAGGMSAGNFFSTSS